MESHTWLRKDDVEFVIQEVAGVDFFDHEVFTFVAKGFVSVIEIHQGGVDDNSVFNCRGSIGVRVT